MVVTVSMLSIRPLLTPNPKQDNINSKRLCVSCLQSERRITAYLVWGNESVWSPVLDSRWWLYRQPPGCLGSAFDGMTCSFFRNYFFKVNLFPCLMPTDITALATRRLTPAFIFKVNRSWCSKCLMGRTIKPHRSRFELSQPMMLRLYWQTTNNIAFTYSKARLR